MAYAYEDEHAENYFQTEDPFAEGLEEWHGFFANFLFIFVAPI
jgi:hypothetical protein